MVKFLVKRVLMACVILFFVMFIIYTLMSSLPTSYMETVAREMSSKAGTTKSYQEWLDELNAFYGMDKGVIVGYFVWLGNAIKGNFGDSWYWTVPVIEKFNEVIWRSFYLGVAAFVLEMGIAIPLGVVAAKKQYGFVDYSVTVVSLIGISLPTFFTASILKWIFAVNLGWFEIDGMQSRYYAMMSPWGQFWDIVWHYILPCMTLVITGIGGVMRYVRTNTLEVLNADYIRTARAKGLSERRVIGYHAFRNTLIPIVTILGNSLPGLFSGALITETLFSIRGIGYASYYSLRNGDIPFTMFYLAFIAILTLLGTLLADVLYAAVDPRVRVN